MKAIFVLKHETPKHAVENYFPQLGNSCEFLKTGENDTYIIGINLPAGLLSEHTPNRHSVSHHML